MITSPLTVVVSGLNWHVGHVLRRLRLTCPRASQRQTAEACGISTNVYRRLEERGEAVPAVLERVASHFQTSVLALQIYAGSLDDICNDACPLPRDCTAYRS